MYNKVIKPFDEIFTTPLHYGVLTFVPTRKLYKISEIKIFVLFLLVPILKTTGYKK